MEGRKQISQQKSMKFKKNRESKQNQKITKVKIIDKLLVD